METSAVRIEFPEGVNVIVGQAHFIKTIEDIYEVMASGAPGSAFAVAFNEASEKRLVRVEGTDDAMRELAAGAATAVGAGHVFVIMMKGAFPITVLNGIKSCPEVCRVFCATANPLEVLVTETSLGRGVVGVVDGLTPVGVEGPEERAERKALVRKIGYKL